jgi:T-complex protein 1 subunit eta
LLSNITACGAVVDAIRTTLGPRGMDKLIVDGRGVATISNDGATILKLLEIVHPAARALVDVARAQDAEVGDGTTSVVLLAGELLKQAKPFIEENVAPPVIIRAFRLAADLAAAHIDRLAVPIPRDDAGAYRQLLERCARTSMYSKIISGQGALMSRLVVDAVLSLDPRDPDERLIGIKRVPGGAIEDAQLVQGVAFRKTFSYAGFEQQPKRFTDSPRLLCLNIELELKAERDNAEVRLERVADYQAVVDAEWSLIHNRLEAIAATGARLVFSKLPIGDLATQFFADRDIFCAGRIPADDMNRIIRATGAPLHSTVSDFTRYDSNGSKISNDSDAKISNDSDAKISNDSDAKISNGSDAKISNTSNTSNTFDPCGSAVSFEERQVGSERWNFLITQSQEASTPATSTKTCTLILRGGSDQFIAEIERALHDAIMIVRRALFAQKFVAGGGAVEMELSRFLREQAKSHPGRDQLLLAAVARALEALPRQLCDNAGCDATDLLTQLRKAHTVNNQIWAGLDLENGTIIDTLAAGIWEPAIVKANMMAAACEAACTILSVDLSIKAAKPWDASAPSGLEQLEAKSQRRR